jgi:hypothetical protein
MMGLVLAIASLAAPVREVVTELVSALRSGDAPAARRALEAALRLQFIARNTKPTAKK